MCIERCNETGISIKEVKYLEVLNKKLLVHQFKRYNHKKFLSILHSWICQYCNIINIWHNIVKTLSSNLRECTGLRVPRRRSRPRDIWHQRTAMLDRSRSYRSLWTWNWINWTVIFQTCIARIILIRGWSLVILLQIVRRNMNQVIFSSIPCNVSLNWRGQGHDYSRSLGKLR